MSYPVFRSDRIYAQWNHFTVLKSYPTITPLDVYPIFNSRPDSTPDGRHTAGEGAFWMDRPETGSAETYVADIIFSSWLLPSSSRID